MSAEIDPVEYAKQKNAAREEKVRKEQEEAELRREEQSRTASRIFSLLNEKVHIHLIELRRRFLEIGEDLNIQQATRSEISPYLKFYFSPKPKYIDGRANNPIVYSIVGMGRQISIEIEPGDSVPARIISQHPIDDFEKSFGEIINNTIREFFDVREEFMGISRIF